MDQTNHAFQDHPPIKAQNGSTHQPPLPASDNGLPILAIAVLGIMATAFLLVSYYIFVNKCCFDWQQIRFYLSQSRHNEDPLMSYSPSWQNRGLDELLIHEIPTIQYARGDDEDRSLSKCIVCLNEFREQDMLRVLPKCSHAFHLHCVDIWLQSNANCPLCRTSISGATRYPIDQIVAPTSSPQDPHPFTDSLAGGDEDYVVIELGGRDETIMPPHGQGQGQPRQQRDGSRMSVQARGHSPRKLEEKHVKLKPRKVHHASIMGDECIDVRDKDDQFSVQTIRRSFSMDSAADRHIYLSVQEMVRQGRHVSSVRNSEECSSRSARRPLFSLRHGGGSKSAVLPIQSD